MPKTTGTISSEKDNRVHPYKPNPNHGKGRDDGRKMEWEDTTCPICMDFPHNAVLLLCSSHDKGCRPYICNTGHRHSNCLRQYQKAHLAVKKSAGWDDTPASTVIGRPPGEVSLTVETMSVTFVHLSAETGVAVSSRRIASLDDGSRNLNSIGDSVPASHRIIGSVNDIIPSSNILSRDDMLIADRTADEDDGRDDMPIAVRADEEDARDDMPNGESAVSGYVERGVHGADGSFNEDAGNPERSVMDEDEQMEEPGVVEQYGVEDFEPDLKCPLCRGVVDGWKVVDGVREHLNQKPRNCSEESCPFFGTYSELKAHARSEHPLARPSEVDPARVRDWRRLEHQRNVDDVLSSIRAAMPGATVIGDHVLETGSENENDDSSLLSVPAFLFLHWFGPPSSGGGRILLPAAWGLRGHRAGSAARTGQSREAATSTVNNHSDSLSVNGDAEQEAPGSTTEHQSDH